MQPTLVLLAPKVVTNMNANPFERANPAAALVAWFFGIFLGLVNGVCQMPPSPHDRHTCPGAPLFLSDHHGHYSVYDTYPKRLR